MVIEIASTEIDSIRYACAKNDFSCHFIPTALEGIVKVRIGNNGRELSPALAYRLGAIVCQKQHADSAIEDEKEALKEADWTPEPSAFEIIYNHEMNNHTEDLPR